ncbi:hypothetical protein SDC9_153795 [bioreactor metagenome]|uniref:Uncharacterized protein n=1 Tax=bioreactor metagenome TaxID=1076179 RepID=A0A645EZC3_9ZZZZ
MLTASPAFSSLSVVSARVVGITPTEKKSLSASITVRLTPSIVTEPFSTIPASSSSGAVKYIFSVLSSDSIRETFAMPSTCPATRWPSRRESSRIARSRLTGEPTFRPPSFVRACVSGIICTLNELASKKVTVLQAPESATESPRRSSEAIAGAWIVSSTTSPAGITAATVPIVSISPVNIQKHPLSADLLRILYIPRLSGTGPPPYLKMPARPQTRDRAR